MSSSVSIFRFLSCEEGEALALAGDLELAFPLSELSVSASDPELCAFLGDFGCDDEVEGWGDAISISELVCLLSGENSSLSMFTILVKCTYSNLCL